MDLDEELLVDEFLNELVMRRLFLDDDDAFAEYSDQPKKSWICKIYGATAT